MSVRLQFLLLRVGDRKRTVGNYNYMKKRSHEQRHGKPTALFIPKVILIILDFPTPIYWEVKHVAGPDTRCSYLAYHQDSES